MSLAENEYDEVDYMLIIKHRPGTDIPESRFNDYAKLIEEKMSNDDFLVMVVKLDPDEYKVRR